VLALRLTQLRKEREKTQDDIAEYLGVSRPTYTGYESGRRKPDYDTLIKLSRLFNVSADYLLGIRDNGPVAVISKTSDGKTVPVPVLGRIKAGIPLMSEANFEGEIEVPKDIKADFALRVSGDSMSWAGIADGDIAILKQVTSPTHGAVVAAVEEDSWEATLKFYVKANSHAVLKAANPEYKDMPITDRHRIIGQLVSLSKNPPVLNDYLAHLMYKGLADKKWELAVEIAQQHGLDGEKVANIISAFGQIGKHVK
jgi:repressor LexA